MPLYKEPNRVVLHDFLSKENVLFYGKDDQMLASYRIEGPKPWTEETRVIVRPVSTMITRS